MEKIVVIGEILVEIMANTPGEGFLTTQDLTGPYPSGAPAIFIDQVARMGQPCGIVSCVGDDDFGRMNVARLVSDGVDVSAVSRDPSRPTGSAFVRYRPSGERDFVFNIEHAACGQTRLTDAARRMLQGADHLHVMGSSLSSDRFVENNLEALEAIRARGGTVSFDPNLRKEMLARQGLRDAMRRILGQTDLFLPSGAELTLLTGAGDEAGAIAELLGQGVSAIVHKRGAGGATYHDATRSVHVDAFPVDEIDPTGAGDCFGGAFTVCWLRKMDPDEALRHAAAAGAMAVGKRGPMEGTSTQAQINAFLNEKGNAR